MSACESRGMPYIGAAFAFVVPVLTTSISLMQRRSPDLSAIGNPRNPPNPTAPLAGWLYRQSMSAPPSAGGRSGRYQSVGNELMIPGSIGGGTSMAGSARCVQKPSLHEYPSIVEQDLAVAGSAELHDGTALGRRS